MKKTFILIVLVLTGFVFAQNRDCSEILNPDECYDMGCEWITLYEEVEETAKQKKIRLKHKGDIK